MNNECSQILNNEKVTEIFNSSNTAMHTKLRNCITTTYREQFYKSVPIYNSSVSPDLLLKAAADIFTESVDKLQLGVHEKKWDFEKDNFQGLLYTMFKNAYLNKLASELTRLKYYAQNEKYIHGYNEPRFIKGELFSYKTYQVLSKTGQPCKDYLVWHYAEDMSIKEISAITGKSADGIKHQLYRCRKYFMDAWNADKAINKQND